MKRTYFLLLLLFNITLISISCKKDKDCNSTDWTNDCVCTEIYAPVCGCDNVTYSNACYAKCQGIAEYTEGECK